MQDSMDFDARVVFNTVIFDVDVHADNGSLKRSLR
jgi:hypothetical protein